MRFTLLLVLAANWALLLVGGVCWWRRRGRRRPVTQAEIDAAFTPEQQQEIINRFRAYFERDDRQ